MAELYGLECTNTKCVHDSAAAYRLRLFVRPAIWCPICKRDGQSMAPQEIAKLNAYDLDDPQDREAAEGWFYCSFGCVQPWRRRYHGERNDMVFRPAQLQSAQAQMAVLGIQEPRIGTNVTPDEGHRSLPPGYDSRMLILAKEQMRRCALYFRWQPKLGEPLKCMEVFQCLFRPDMTAAARRTAQERGLTEEEFGGLLQSVQVDALGEPVMVPASMADDGSEVEPARPLVVTYSLIRCQHCMQPLPLQAFNGLTVKGCYLGD